MATVGIAVREQPLVQKGAAGANAGGRRAKLKLDPTKALEPVKKKLNSIEGERIMNVVDDVMRKIEMSSLLPLLFDDVERYSIMLGADLVDAVKQHHEAVLSFQEQHASERQETEDDDETMLRDCELELKWTLKNVLRQFAANPVSLGSLRNDSSAKRRHPSEPVKKLYSEMDEVKAIFLERLLTTPIEENSRNEYFSHINELYAQNTAVIEKLENELAEAIQDREQAVSEKNEQIRKLEADIQSIKKLSEENIRKMRMEKEKQEQSDNKDHEGQMSRLHTDLSKLKGQLQSLVTENREAELKLRQKKWKLESDIETCIQNYDREMGELQKEFEEIDERFNEEQRMLFELRAKFEPIKDEYVEIMKERKYKQEKLDEEHRQVVRMIKAATTIQAFWRSYKVRKVLKKGKKGGKKGKKGAKKGKKTKKK